MNRLVVGARELPNALDGIRRYCGLPWSGGAPETWAYRYFDAIDDPCRDALSPTDVIVTSALHPGLKQSDLAWFWEHGREVTQLLNELPRDLPLAEASPDLVSRLQELPERFAGAEVELSLLSKVLHRKRPALVPMLDRAILDRYRGKLPARGAQAWPAMVPLIREDLQQPGNVAFLAAAAESLARELGFVPPALRLLDIAVWMDARPRTAQEARGRSHD
jgi:hypothetical protein